MSVELYCRKKVTSDQEHTMLVLMLQPADHIDDHYMWNNHKNDIQIIYDTKNRILEWGGWRYNKIQNEGAKTAIRFEIHKMIGKSSKSLKRLLINLLKWDATQKDLEQWTRFWDKNTSWRFE